MTNFNSSSQSLGWNFIGWKAYNGIKKKAMEQEFSWSGLLLSMFIAFFVVLFLSQLLNAVHVSIINKQTIIKNDAIFRIYKLESVQNSSLQASNFINIQV